MTTEQEALKILTLLLPPGALDQGKILVFQQVWIGKNYTAIAEEFNYPYPDICKAAVSLWQLLSCRLGVTVTRKNFRTLLQNYAADHTYPLAPPYEVPGGPVPLDSPFYISRPLLEAKAFAAIAKPAGLLRLKAPQKMGKSTLMLRLIQHALSLNYRTVFLDLQLAERDVLSDSDRFLRWLCAALSHGLGFAPQIEQYWNAGASSLANCSIYLQRYLLQQMHTPIVVLINEVNRVFDYPTVAEELLCLIRSLHEAARYVKQVQKLRLVLAYSTEIDVASQLNQSPFYLGSSIKLPHLSLAEIQKLAERYGLDWADVTGTQHALTLYKLVGGHPYLVQLALYHLAHWTTAPGAANKGAANKADAFDRLIAAAPTLDGIYSDHLQRHLSVLYTHPELMTAVGQVLAESDVPLHPIQKQKLQSLGLIRSKNNCVVISCQLYQLFFNRYLSKDLLLDWSGIWSD